MPKADFIRSALRIFLSVDIVGSTAFKQGKAAVQKTEKPSEPFAPPAEPWFSPIVQFYREVERLFAKEWQHYCVTISQKQHWPTGPNPEFWKGAGDELIYTKELCDHKEALACLHTWMKAINSYRTAFRKTYPSLDLKSAAWLAGFPVQNAEVFFRSSVSETADKDDDDPIYSNLGLLEKYYGNPPDKAIVRDFIGPAMDTGFRLASLATPRKLIVSVDLALMLVHATRTQQTDFGYEPISFHYDGRVPLKGVLGGTPYPVFWIDMASQDKLYKAEDQLAATEAVNSDRVKEFCEIFVADHSNFVFKPYIVNNIDPFFRDMPAHHAERLETLKLYWVKEKERRKAESEAELSNEATDAAISGKSLDINVLIREIGKLTRDADDTRRNKKKPTAKKKLRPKSTRRTTGHAK